MNIFKMRERTRKKVRAEPLSDAMVHQMLKEEIIQGNNNEGNIHLHPS